MEPIRAYLVGSEPAPPPPPPPPPAAVESRPETVIRERVPVETSFVQPTVIPETIPETDLVPTETTDPAGVPGGVDGGVEGGIVGGVVGGIIGGEIGGVIGGVPGGQGEGPYRPGNDVSAPVAIYKVDPPYTEEARKARVQGIVILEAVVDVEGNVTDIEVLKPLQYGLDETAVEALRQWKYKPGKRDGQPVPVLMTVSVSFRLQ